MRKIQERLGSGIGDAMELRNSKFMSTLNWDMVLEKAYEPEFRPPAMRGECLSSSFMYFLRFTKKISVCMYVCMSTISW